MNEGLQQRLKTLRKEHKLSQADVANWFNLDPSTVSNWESGNSSPDLEKLVILADKFGCSVDYLIGRLNKKSPTNEGEASIRIVGYGKLTNDEIMKVALEASNQAVLAVLKALDKKD